MREGGPGGRKPEKMCAIIRQWHGDTGTRGQRGQWGEIRDINELVPDPVSWVSARHHQTHWPFMLTDDFITEVMSGLAAEKCGETQPTSFQRRKIKWLSDIFYTWNNLLSLCPGSGYAENFLNVWWRNYSREWRRGVCQLSNFGC